MNADTLYQYLEDTETNIFETLNLAKTLNQQVSKFQTSIETLVKRGTLHRIEKGK